MSIKIYEKYAVEHARALTVSDKEKVNKSYLFNGELFYKFLRGQGFTDFSFLVVLGGGLEFVTEAKKMMVINGVELNAPRFDMPKNKDNVYFFLPHNVTYKDGVGWASVTNSISINDVMKSGWFDNYNDYDAFMTAFKGAGK